MDAGRVGVGSRLGAPAVNPAASRRNPVGEGAQVSVASRPAPSLSQARVRPLPSLAAQMPSLAAGQQYSRFQGDGEPDRLRVQAAHVLPGQGLGGPARRAADPRPLVSVVVSPAVPTPAPRSGGRVPVGGPLPVPGPGRVPVGGIARRVNNVAFPVLGFLGIVLFGLAFVPVLQGFVVPLMTTGIGLLAASLLFGRRAYMGN